MGVFTPGPVATASSQGSLSLPRRPILSGCRVSVSTALNEESDLLELFGD